MKKATVKNYKYVDVHYSKNSNGSKNATVYTRKDGKCVIPSDNEWKCMEEIKKRGLKIVKKHYN